MIPMRVRKFFSYKDLLYNLVARDLKVRYKHSFLGFFWSLLNPLLLTAVFTFVFSQILPDQARPMFNVYFLCALLPWTWCATAVTGSLASIVGNGHLIKKVYFPREMLPVSVVISTMINCVLSIPALLFFMIFFRPEELAGPFSAACTTACINAHLLFLPVLLVSEMFFLLGLGMIVASLNVFFRDTSILVEVGLQAWFFLTPIIYDAKLIAKQYTTLLYYVNPMASIIANFRDIFYYNEASSPDPLFMLRTFITSLILFAGGYMLFTHTK
ncbi:MAG: ABC transporter permease, partial [Chloroflexia bacterium]